MWAAPLQTNETLANNLGDDTNGENGPLGRVRQTRGGNNARILFLKWPPLPLLACKMATLTVCTWCAPLQTALDERALQIWSTQPTIAAELAGLGWDGGLHPSSSLDFLALVDTNMGYNKVDAVVERALTYQLQWPTGPGTPALATTTVTLSA